MVKELENKIIATNGEVDFWYIENQIYRSKPNSILDIYGLPQDRRWECSYKHWLIYKDSVFSWVDQVAEEKNELQP
jgi:hypothetical protein